jgi:NDP-sugar pyrophosphorylase family protein
MVIPEVYLFVMIMLKAQMIEEILILLKYLTNLIEKFNFKQAKNSNFDKKYVKKPNILSTNNYLKSFVTIMFK